MTVPDSAVAPCPHCGAPTSLDQSQCPRCGGDQGLEYVDEPQTSAAAGGPFSIDVGPVDPFQITIHPKRDWINFEPSTRYPLFNVTGRLSRQEFWMVYLALGVVNVGVVMVMGLLAVLAITKDNGTLVGMAFGYGFFLLMFIETWIAIVAQVKRWHDLDYSGWWTLMNLVPIAGMIINGVLEAGAVDTTDTPLGFITFSSGLFIVIGVGLRRGTKGPNRFGNDPASRRKVF